MVLFQVTINELANKQIKLDFDELSRNDASPLEKMYSEAILNHFKAFLTLLNIQNKVDEKPNWEVKL